MTLQQCTKAELLWVIDRACMHNLSDWAIKAGAKVYLMSAEAFRHYFGEEGGETDA